MKFIAALTGMVALVAVAVLGAAAGRQPFFDFLWAENPAMMQIEPLPAADCTAEATIGVDWSSCDKTDLMLIGSGPTSLVNANLSNTILVNSLFIGVNMAGAIVEGADLTNANWNQVDLTGATGTPTGTMFQAGQLTCPDGTVISGRQNDVSTMCNWTPAGPPPTATPTNTPEAATETPTSTPEAPTETPTNTPEVPTETPTSTPEAPTETPTNTPEAPTETPTNTPEAPTATPTNTPEAATETPTSTPEAPTETPTATPEAPTETPTSTPEAPTETPTSTPEAPTDTPEAPTATPTNTPEAPVCLDLIVNGDFEGTDGWRMQPTEYQARYSEEQALSPAQSGRTGISSPGDNAYSFSSAVQTVTIPAGVTAATLTFNIYPQTSEPMHLLVPATMSVAMSMGKETVGDAQWVLILDSNGRELQRLVSKRSNARTWEAYEFDLSEYRGLTIQIYFGTFNNGWGGVSAMYVDDVALVVCTGEAVEETAVVSLPVLLADHPLGISGRLVDALDQPLAGEVVRLDNGQQTVTDANGVYAFSGLAADTYVISVQQNGFVFSPSERLVVLPPSAPEQDFVGSVSSYP